MKIKHLLLAVMIICLCGAIVFSAVYVRDNLILSKSMVVDKNTNTIWAKNDSLRILQLTDIQTCNMEECEAAYPIVRALVEETNPDMLVLTGDNISANSSREVLDYMISQLDSFKRPWALVFGNHDRESLVSMEEICQAIENSEYGILQTGNLTDRYGNYYYTVYINGKAVRSLIFMDSAKGNFTTEQVEWYRDTVSSIEERYNKKVKSFLFYHIPLCEVTEAHEIYKNDPTIGSGVQNEVVCDQGENTGLLMRQRRWAALTQCFTDTITSIIPSLATREFCYATD